MTGLIFSSAHLWWQRQTDDLAAAGPRRRPGAPRTVLIVALMVALSPVDASIPPGAEPRPEALQRKLERAWQEQNEPAASSPEFLNRLILEHSPYLRQHADNPVDWFPWGEEALRRARETGRPIFLSIGYSTCYWCHVMEQESFRDPQLAHRLNSDFIPIKVDRERRPELDEYYLQAQQMLFGAVGWPVSMVLTPEAQPVFAASYLAPEAFGRFLGQVAEAWQLRRAQLERRAQKVARTLAPSRYGDPIELSSALRLGAVSALVEAADMVHGGFGRGEKFPSVNRLLLLLDAAARDHHQAAGRVALHALRAMSRGGVRDQLGGGFHRYALDRQWRRPHFEKMLYTQSSLAEALIAAVRLSGDVELAASLRDCLDFVMRGLQQPQGGFSSAVAAQDAGGEGAYYLWTKPQIAARLGPDAASLFEQFIGLAKQSPEADSGVLYQIQPAFDFARQQSWAGGEYRLWWEAQRQTLLAARVVRPVPEVDDKVILAWNARMISVMLHASEVLQARHYRDAAEKAFDFLQGELLRSDGLRRVWWRGQVSTLAQLDDYAALGLLYLDFYRLNGRTELLVSAQDLADAAWLRFVEPLRKGENPDGLHESRIFPRATRDQEQPHAYALTAELFSRLASLSPGGQYKRRYQQLLAGLSRSIALQPADHTSLLRVAAEHAGGRLENRVVAAGGHARIHLTRSPQGFDLDLELEDGWHINAHETGESLLLPTVVTGLGDQARGLRIEYPPPLSELLAFESRPLLLYDGRFRIRGHRPVDQHKRMLVLQLRMQACNDSLCLAPETVLLHLPADIPVW